jgi:hypothetical protein
LDHIADIAAEFIAVHTAGVFATYEDAPLGGFDESVDEFEGGGFTTAGLADEHDYFAGRNFQGELVDGGFIIAVTFGHVFQ